MKKIVLCCLVVVALSFGCGSDSKDPYTWGEASQELSEAYCSGLAQCGYTSGTPEIMALCVEHNSWHMCEPDMTCDVEVDEAQAVAALDKCAVALLSLDDFECYMLGYYGFLPEACVDILSLWPSPEA